MQLMKSKNKKQKQYDNKFRDNNASQTMILFYSRVYADARLSGVSKPGGLLFRSPSTWR